MTSVQARDRVHADIVALRAANEHLAEIARQYREALTPPLAFPAAWGLTRGEGRILAALHAHPRGLTLHALHIAYSDRVDPETEINIVRVALNAVRRKTEHRGIKIDTLYCPITSYRLAHGSRDIIDLALAAPCAKVWAILDDRKLTIAPIGDEPAGPAPALTLHLPEQLAAHVRAALEAWK